MHFGVFEERGFSGNKVIWSKYVTLRFFQLSPTNREHRPNFAPIGANGNSAMLIFGASNIWHGICRLQAETNVHEKKKPTSYIEHNFVQVWNFSNYIFIVEVSAYKCKCVHV